MVLKPILIVSLFLLSHLLYSQVKKNTYNTTINKADTVNIKEGVTTILKAGNVYVKIFVDLNTKPKVHYEKMTQELDNSGEYVTTIFLKNPHPVEYFDIDIELASDKPIKDAILLPNASGEIDNDEKKWSEDRQHWSFTSPRILSREGIHITLRSKEKIKINILKGVQGPTN